MSAEDGTRKQTIYGYEETFRELEKIAEQRKREKSSELYRQSLQIGALFIAISGEPGEDGRYGTLTPSQLAHRIKPLIAAGIEWLADNGHPIRGLTGGGDMAALGALMGLVQQQGGGRPLAPSSSPTSQETLPEGEAPKQFFIDQAAFETMELGDV